MRLLKWWRKRRATKREKERMVAHCSRLILKAVSVSIRRQHAVYKRIENLTLSCGKTNVSLDKSIRLMEILSRFLRRVRNIQKLSADYLEANR